MLRVERVAQEARGAVRRDGEAERNALAEASARFGLDDGDLGALSDKHVAKAVKNLMLLEPLLNFSFT